ncbi:MAG: hypothetical protein NC092_00890 [Butyrivibrio sp.]|nr:hypothetical protein [Muribaculum sp.]MCM1551228.1 hypothetical protein [Butyrivibrio sp.]
MNQVKNVITIGEKEKKVEVLEVNIGKSGESFNIPLAASLSVKDVNRMTTKKGTIEFMLEQIPEEYQAQISYADLITIMKAWTEASKKEGNISVGEF